MTPKADYEWPPDTCEHEYTPNADGTHAWCQKCDSVISLAPVDGSES